MIVWCDSYECKYCEEGQCKAEVIYIDEDHECRDFESYLEEKEWSIPFWKRMLDRDNDQICRVQYFGKEVEVKGRKFYVESKSEYATVTDGETGLSCGSRFELEKRIDRIIELTPTIEPKLEELPIATYDGETRKFIYESEVQGE
jgi:hypothetical protein